MSPFNIASSTNFLISPTFFPADKLNISIISCPLTGDWNARNSSVSITSRIRLSTRSKLARYFLTLFGFLVVISARHNNIRSFASSDASTINLLIAESVTSFFAKLIGRKCKAVSLTM